MKQDVDDEADKNNCGVCDLYITFNLNFDVQSKL